MIGRYDALDALFDFQRALEARLESDWLRGTTAGTGAFPPINVFQQGDNLVAILELPGVNKSDLEIQAKDPPRIGVNQTICGAKARGSCTPRLLRLSVH